MTRRVGPPWSRSRSRGVYARVWPHPAPDDDNSQRQEEQRAVGEWYRCGRVAAGTDRERRGDREVTRSPAEHDRARLAAEQRGDERRDQRSGREERHRGDRGFGPQRREAAHARDDDQDGERERGRPADDRQERVAQGRHGARDRGTGDEREERSVRRGGARPAPEHREHEREGDDQRAGDDGGGRLHAPAEPPRERRGGELGGSDRQDERAGGEARGERTDSDRERDEHEVRQGDGREIARAP